MQTLTLKIPPDLERSLVEASAHAQISKSELVRQALRAYLGQGTRAKRPASALDLAGDLVGCCEGGPPDLSHHPRHLQDFGLDRDRGTRRR